MNNKTYIKWKVYSVTTIKKGYGFRIKIFFDDGTDTIIQKSGFKKRSDAIEYRNQVIVELSNGTFVIDNQISIETFFTFWLYEYMVKVKELTYNSFLSYRNVINNYLIPAYGCMKMSIFNKRHLHNLYLQIFEKSPNVLKIAKVVFNTALEYAEKHHIISKNFSDTVEFKVPHKQPYKTLNIDSSKVLTIPQAKLLISKAKNTPIYFQIMFALLMGLRISEINGLKYSDVDFINRKIKVERQLGVDMKKDKNKLKKKTYTKQEIKTKTPNSVRWLDIPDMLFEEILEQRKTYEKNKKRRINDKKYPFYDGDYICCSTYGHSRSKSYHFQYFKKLLLENNLPNIHFHDLRHTFATILLQANFSAKAISQLLGHSSEIITVDVYCDTQYIAYDCLDVLNPFIDSIIKEDKYDIDCTDINIDECFRKYFNVPIY